jgi:hypothetical protein
MARLEDLKARSLVQGIKSGQPVTIVDLKWFGSDVVEITFKDQHGKADTALLFRENEATLEIDEGGLAWSFDAPGDLLRLVSEAQRIGQAYLFDPLLAVHSSDVDPLLHQITAVYEEMLTRQPLRFLLADDPSLGEILARPGFRPRLSRAPGDGPDPGRARRASFGTRPSKARRVFDR